MDYILVAIEWIKKVVGAVPTDPVIIGTIPQWGTALIALVALGVAYTSLNWQRDTARKRATIDFFLKTSMDKECLQTYETFKVEIEKFTATDFDPARYKKTEGFKSVRVWLNICELISVGVNRGVFDDRLAFDCWSNLLPWSCEKCLPLIDDTRSATPSAELAGSEELREQLDKFRWPADERSKVEEKRLEPGGLASDRPHLSGLPYIDLKTISDRWTGEVGQKYAAEARKRMVKRAHEPHS